MRPKKVNILGKEYRIIYCKKPSDVDIHQRESLWGQIDYWTRTIRIFDDGKRTETDIFHTVIHEILHGIISDLNLSSLDTGNKKQHDEIDSLALALADIFTRNKWLKE